MVRMRRTFLLMGCTFCLGLLIGLLMHLPSPAHGPTQDQQPHYRHHRSLQDHEDANSDTKSDDSTRNAPTLNHVDTDSRKNRSLAKDSLPRDQYEIVHSVHLSPVLDSLNGLQSQIKHTQDTIRALKLHQHPPQVVELSKNSHPGSQKEIEYEQNPTKMKSKHSHSSDSDGKANNLGGQTVTVMVSRKTDKSRKSKTNANSKSSESLRYQPMNPVSRTATSKDVNEVLSGIYWRPLVEMAKPQGFTDQDIIDWRKRLQNNKVVRVAEGCGRMQNREITLEDGTKACARYRLNTDQIQGEIMSYHLARLLGIPNLVPAVLALADPTSPSWAGVSSSLIDAQWSPNKAMVLTPWQHDLQSAFIPPELRVKDGKLHPGPGLLQSRDLADVIELSQWSDLIILDYLTANVDRVVNNLFNEQWNPSMMDAPAHNLNKAQSLSQGQGQLLLFLDNESGLFHSYRLLDKYATYHNRLLKATCVFRKSTADAIKTLHLNQNAGTELNKMFKSSDPLHDMLPVMALKNQQILQDRVADVYRQLVECEHLYGPGNL